MKCNPLLAFILPLCFLTSCASVPDKVDGIPVTKAEQQAAKQAQDRRVYWESPNGAGFFAVPVAIGMLHAVGVNVGHNSPKLLEGAVREVRQTKQERDRLTVQLNEAKANNQKLATHCAELLGEVDSLKGKPHATFDQRKDVLDQIKQQMSRMDYADTKTDQAIKKNQELLANVKSSGGGHDKEMKDLQAQIQSLQAKQEKFAEMNAKLAQMRKEISTR